MLEDCQYLKAQDKYVEAIRIYPRNEDILQRMILVLSVRCQMEGKYCNKTVQYKDFLTKIQAKKVKVVTPSRS